jgi:hypothetical protein
MIRQRIDARAHLHGLVGKTIPTMTKRPNIVLRIEGESVMVGTEKSPQGKPVPIEWIQAALDRLVREGEIEVSVTSVGYRSAFIGAVLLTVPGTRMQLNPRRVMLDD